MEKDRSSRLDVGDCKWKSLEGAMSFQELVLKPSHSSEGCSHCGGKVSVYYDNSRNYLYQCLEVNCRTQVNMVDGKCHTEVLDADKFSRLIADVVENIEEE